MNDTQQRFARKALQHYGISVGSETVWFIDDGTVYYGLEDSSGEISDYLSGYICGSTFVIEYFTNEGKLDIEGWGNFLNSIDLKYIDARH